MLHAGRAVADVDGRARGVPGQFQALAGLYIDKNNRMFTSEQYPGRVQMFRYFTDDEARADWQRQAEEDKKHKRRGETGAAGMPRLRPREFCGTKAAIEFGRSADGQTGAGANRLRAAKAMT